MEFLGYVRPDGRVGARNHVLVISADPGINGLCTSVANSVNGAMAVPAWPDQGGWLEYVNALAANPNVAGAVILDPETQGPGRGIAETLSRAGKPSDLVALCDFGGFAGGAARAVRSAVGMARESSAMRRQVTLVSRLVLGVIYSGSPGTAELIRHCINTVVENNGRVVLSRNVRDKKDSLGKLAVAGRLSFETGLSEGRGVYEIEHQTRHRILADMASKGVQVVVSAEDRPLPATSLILPVINITADKQYFESAGDNVDLNLSELDYGKYSKEDFSLILVSEIISTASGKLTKSEALKVY